MKLGGPGNARRCAEPPRAGERRLHRPRPTIVDPITGDVLRVVTGGMAYLQAKDVHRSAICPPRARDLCGCEAANRRIRAAVSATTAPAAVDAVLAA